LSQKKSIALYIPKTFIFIMKPEHIALGEYYFNKKSISDAAKEAGIEEEELANLIDSIDKKAVEALSEFYRKGGSLGRVAENHGLTRLEIFGYMHKHRYNTNYDDKKSKEKIMSAL